MDYKERIEQSIKTALSIGARCLIFPKTGITEEQYKILKQYKHLEEVDRITIYF